MGQRRHQAIISLDDLGLAERHFWATTISEAMLQAVTTARYLSVHSARLEQAKIVARRVIELEPNFTVAEFVRAHTGRTDIWSPMGEELRRVGLPD